MEEKKEKPVLSFLMKTLNGMAYGLFATLIVGTIFATFGNFFKEGASSNQFCNFMYRIFGDVKDSQSVSSVLKNLTGAGIGVGIALALKFDALKTIVLAGVGELAACTSISTMFITNPGSVDHLSISFQVGDPLTIYLVCISVALLMKYLIRKKTPVDIIIIPLFGVIFATFLSLGLRYPATTVTYAIQWLVGTGTKAVPFVSGMVVAVLMGMALTAPISSAAIAAMVFKVDSSLSPEMLQGLMLASGAAVVGCSTQMIGFAVQSRKDNNVGTVISIGIGTSMLQFKNILKKPVIWLPTIIASAILGPISTCWLELTCMKTDPGSYASAGMGTAGLVGQIGTIDSMGVSNWQVWVGIFGLMIILPGVLVFFIDLLFRKLGWIKEGDLTV